ncbi:MAG: acetyl-CoA carboxylase biotin carboxyl carrier protein subunit [Bacteroidales bacterium]|nr:acetyl-CoA carboxylase biotin carboxyl carrier protein subunit [Bacteroidales bacterium]
MNKRDLKIEELKIFHCVYKTRLSDKFRKRKLYQPADHRKIICYIPGTIVEILVKKGDTIVEGSEILILEAMKMKNRIKCQASGTIKSINISEGDKVPKGKLLIEIE